MSNRVKTLKIQNYDGTFTDNIQISPNASNVFLNNNNDLQTVLGNLNFTNNNENVATRLEYLARMATSGINPTTQSSSNFNNWDQNKIYLYTGTTTTSTTPNLTNGYWYYYDTNSSQWKAGGNYTAIQSDTTLTVSGQAADAKATGDRIDEIPFATVTDTKLIFI